MITITRSLARQLRNVFRRAGLDKHPGEYKDYFALRAGSDGLRVQAVSERFAVEYHQPGQFDAEEFIVPRSLLAAAEGRHDDPVTIELQDRLKVLVSWTDGGIPQVAEHAVVESAGIAVKVPAMPDAFVSNPPQLRSALQAAATITETDPTRYALDCLQLRGSEGKIVATDGRQVLVQSGFQFPWSEELLIPGSKAFGCRELPDSEGLDVGLVENWVVFRNSPWTIWLRVNSGARFPKVDDLIGKPSAASSRLLISDSDADFLQDALERLPSDDAMQEPVTLDLKNQLIVRSKPAGGTRVTELVLSGCTLLGDHTAIHTNRRFLAKALELGFREVCFFGTRSPALCDDGQRQYLWALLDPESVIAPSDDAIRVDSAAHVPASHIDQPRRARKRLAVAASPAESNGTPVARPRHVKPDKPSLTPYGHSCIEQAIVLRTTLRETLIHTNELIRTLKREKRQSRLVASTLASLKQLQKVAG